MASEYDEWTDYGIEEQNSGSWYGTFTEILGKLTLGILYHSANEGEQEEDPVFFATDGKKTVIVNENGDEQKPTPGQKEAINESVRDAVKKYLS